MTDQWKPGTTGSNGIWGTCYLRDLNRIDGEPMEFEWTNFPGFTTLKILDEIQKMMTELQCEPEQLKGRIIFMSMYNDIVWENEETKTIVLRILSKLQIVARTLVIMGPGSEKKWYGTHPNKPDREWDRTG